MPSMFGMASTAVISSHIARKQSTGTGGASRANKALWQIKVLEANLSKAFLLCEAMWELLSEKHGLTEQELQKKVFEIDMRDGVFDGKNQRKAVQCPECSHTVSSRHPACLYCGKVIDDSVFTMG